MNLVSPAVEAQEEILWSDNDELPEGVKAGDIKQEAVEAQEAVYERALDDEGNPDWNWGFNGRPIIAMLVKAVQELSAKVEALENA